MTNLSNKWNRLPRSTRAGLMMAVGASAALAFERTAFQEASPQNIKYAIGVKCASEAASVEYIQKDNAWQFHCKDYAGNELKVMGLGQLRHDYRLEGSGYTAAVDVSAITPDDHPNQAVIRFSFEEIAGRAEVRSSQQIPGDFPNSAHLNAIFRVEN